jgi:hypothetical protein
MTLDTYAHLFDELQGAERASAEHLIRVARTQTASPEVSVLCPPDDDPVSTNSENPWKSERADARTRTGDPFITRHGQAQVDAGRMWGFAGGTGIPASCGGRR